MKFLICFVLNWLRLLEMHLQMKSEQHSLLGSWTLYLLFICVYYVECFVGIWLDGGLVSSILEISYIAHNVVRGRRRHWSTGHRFVVQEGASFIKWQNAPLVANFQQLRLDCTVTLLVAVYTLWATGQICDSNLPNFKWKLYSSKQYFSND